MPHITQIAATNIQTGAALDVYVTPKRPITLDAQKVTGIAMQGNNTMTVNGTEVQHVGIQSAIDQLCAWLENYSNVVLIAQNGRRFDFPVIMSALIHTNTTERFIKCVTSFIDSLPVFKKIFPNQSHRQEDLALSCLGISYNAHNALADVETLGKLVNHTQLSQSDLLKYSFSPEAVYNSRLFSLQKSKNIKSLEILVSRGICKMPTAENIAGSGLNLSHLSKIFERAGEDGLRDTFIMKNSEGLPRVTNVKRILDDVIPKIAAFFKQ